MANILSGANFGLVMPQGANPNFGAELSAQLLGQATAAMREKATQDRRLENLQKLDTKRNELLSKAAAEKTRLNVMYTELDRIYNMPHGPAKRTALAKLGNAEGEAGRDHREFIAALNASTPDQLNMNINELRTKAGALADQVDKVMAANARKPLEFEPIQDADGNILAQRNVNTGEVKIDPRASKLFSEEEIQQKLQLIQARAAATVAEQQGTPQAQATLDLTNERLKALQQDKKLKDIKLDETVIKNEAEKTAAREVKEIRFNEASGVVDQINGLMEGDRFELAFGKAVTATPELLRSQPAIDAIAEVDQLRALLSLESRQKLKGSGTISDNEQKTLEKSATVLANPLISAELAYNELVKVKRIFEDSARRNRVKKAEQPTQEIPEGSTATNPATGQTIIFRGGKWQAQ